MPEETLFLKSAYFSRTEGLFLLTVDCLDSRPSPKELIDKLNQEFRGAAFAQKDDRGEIMKTGIRMIIGLALVAQMASAQVVTYTRDRNGKLELKVPTVDNESPSILLNENTGVIAMGGAAKILANRAALNEQTASTEVVLKKQPLFSQGEYVGSLTEIAPRTFVTAAHVLNKINQKELTSVINKLGLSSQTEILQGHSHGQFLDIVVVTDRGVDSFKDALSSLMGDKVLQPGDLFALSHLVLLDSRLVEQKSRGSLSLSEDKNTVYLPNGLDSFLTWGSSGSVVLASSPQNVYFAGLVQCVVQTNVASSSARTSQSYFRALSANLIGSATWVSSQLSDLSLRMADYQLEKCGPVSGKDGGG